MQRPGTKQSWVLAWETCSWAVLETNTLCGCLLGSSPFSPLPLGGQKTSGLLSQGDCSPLPCLDVDFQDAKAKLQVAGGAVRPAQRRSLEHREEG